MEDRGRKGENRGGGAGKGGGEGHVGRDWVKEGKEVRASEPENGRWKRRRETGEEKETEEREPIGKRTGGREKREALGRRRGGERPGGESREARE